VHWYGWIAAGVLALISACVVAVLATRRTERGRRFWSLTGRGKLAFGRSLLRDRATPWPGRLALVVLVGYLLMPFDLIPDFLPFVGQVDDLLVLALIVGLLLALLPRERVEAALVEGERVSGCARPDGSRPRPPDPPVRDGA
jgi:uncharacterized membrane protein YkvA (DUF1232 family)